MTCCELLGRHLRAGGYVADTWLDAIRERERAYPTGLACQELGVAIPHADPCHIIKPYIAVVRPKTPVAFEPMAGMGDMVGAQLIVNLALRAIRKLVKRTMALGRWRPCRR